MSKKRNKKIQNKSIVNENNSPTVNQLKEFKSPKWKPFQIVLLLALFTIIVYNGVLKSDFCYYDDDYYITMNKHVLEGLSWDNFAWAFTSVGYADNWHPLTWLSHMLDVQLFGINPAGHHFINLLFHIVALLLLFCFLRYATGELWIASIVAGLFALHPMHVESVAWVAERKDVLSAIFCFATMWAYAFYARQASLRRYAMVFVLFALGLLAKPMLVTLPVVLLLLDYWPLERFSKNVRIFGWLIIEKLPLFALTIASSIITIVAQHGAIGNLNKYRIATRISNAIISYGIYIGQVFWPVKLAVLYPFTRPNAGKVLVCSLLLITITTAVIWVGRQKKYLITGWLWFLVTLVPVIGIVQVGSQAHADRYTYIPYIGLFIMFAYGFKVLRDKIPRNKKWIMNTFLAVFLLAMIFKTSEQIGYWKNGITLFSHTIDVTKGNEIAQYNLGNILLQTGRADEAIAHYIKALEINPNKINALCNLAGAYYQKKQFSDAIPLMQRALVLTKASGDSSQTRDIEENLERLTQALGSTQKP